MTLRESPSSDSEKWSNLPEVTHLGSGRASTQINLLGSKGHAFAQIPKDQHRAGGIRVVCMAQVGISGICGWKLL